MMKVNCLTLQGKTRKTSRKHFGLAPRRRGAARKAGTSPLFKYHNRGYLLYLAGVFALATSSASIQAHASAASTISPLVYLRPGQIVISLFPSHPGAEIHRVVIRKGRNENRRCVGTWIYNLLLGWSICCGHPGGRNSLCTKAWHLTSAGNRRGRARPIPATVS